MTLRELQDIGLICWILFNFYWLAKRRQLTLVVKEIEALLSLFDDLFNNNTT